MRAGGLVVGPEPSKLMARVQIPAGAFSAERSEAKIATKGFEPCKSQRANEVSATVLLRFKSRPAHPPPSSRDFARIRSRSYANKRRLNVLKDAGMVELSRAVI